MLKLKTIKLLNYKTIKFVIKSNQRTNSAKYIRIRTNVYDLILPTNQPHLQCKGNFQQTTRFPTISKRQLIIMLKNIDHNETVKTSARFSSQTPTQKNRGLLHKSNGFGQRVKPFSYEIRAKR